MEREYLSREPRQYTKKEKLQNWFYYHKWHLVVGAVLLWMLGSVLFSLLGIGQVRPDYQIAYVGTRQLPQTAVQALEEALAAFGEDVNGDGNVVVTVTTHVNAENAVQGDVMGGYTSTLTVLGDIYEGESTFFLLQDPAAFQKEFGILARLDGSVPPKDDTEIADKALLWADCPVLRALELGSYEMHYPDYTETGSVQELLSGLYLCRRYYDEPGLQEDPQADEAFWAALTGGAGK